MTPEDALGDTIAWVALAVAVLAQIVLVMSRRQKQFVEAGGQGFYIPVWKLQFKALCVALLVAFVYFDQPWLAFAVVLYLGGKWSLIIITFVLVSVFGVNGYRRRW